jgi:hemoglobin
MMKKEIENSEDIKNLVNGFYGKAREDDLIGYIFEDVAKVDWDKHLPQMYAFWENVAFYTGGYKGNVIAPHFELNKKVRLLPEHFQRWLAIFAETIDNLFEGSKSEELKERALSIGGIMEYKIKAMANNEHNP